MTNTLNSKNPQTKEQTNIPQETLISIVVPVYNEAKNVPLLVEALVEEAGRLPYQFEFLLVDDGSRDRSARTIQQLAKKEPRIRFVQLARNFGKEAAVSAGIGEARGAAVIIMDADLQMPPALMGQFIEKWQQGAEVVVGVFAERNMGRLRQMGAQTI